MYIKFKILGSSKNDIPFNWTKHPLQLSTGKGRRDNTSDSLPIFIRLHEEEAFSNISRTLIELGVSDREFVHLLCGQLSGDLGIIDDEDLIGRAISSIDFTRGKLFGICFGKFKEWHLCPVKFDESISGDSLPLPISEVFVEVTRLKDDMLSGALKNDVTNLLKNIEKTQAHGRET